MKAGAGRKGLVKGYMVVTEDEMVHFVGAGVFQGKFIERFILSPENISGIMGETVVSGPPVAETECNPRMQEAEKELCHLVVEQAAEETVAKRDRTQTITMTQTEHIPADGHETRLFEALHSQFFKIGICPYIMIPLEEIYLHTPVHQVGQGTEHPNITLRDDITVFIPEIPDVPKKVQSLRLRGQRPQEIHKTPFPVKRVRHIQTKMDVSHEI